MGGPTGAQSYPNKPIRLIVPFALDDPIDDPSLGFDFDESAVKKYALDPSKP